MSDGTTTTGPAGTDPADTAPDDGQPDGDGGQTPSPKTDTRPAKDDAPAGAAKDTTEKDQPSGDDKGDKTARTIAAIRQDFKDERAKRQEYQQRTAAAEQAASDLERRLDELIADQRQRDDALAKALGLKTDDTPPDPAEIAKELEAKLAAAQAEIETERQRVTDGELARRDVEVRLAVYQNATKHGGDGDALLDSASFLRSVSKLNPADDDFTDRLGEVITEAVGKNPRLAKPEPKSPGKSGAEHTSPTPPAKKRARSLTEAVGRVYRT